MNYIIERNGDTLYILALEPDGTYVKIGSAWDAEKTIPLIEKANRYDSLERERM